MYPLPPPPSSRLFSLHRSLRWHSRQYLPPFLLFRHHRRPSSPHPLHRPHAGGAHWQRRSVLGRSIGRQVG